MTGRHSMPGAAEQHLAEQAAACAADLRRLLGGSQTPGTMPMTGPLSLSPVDKAALLFWAGSALHVLENLAGQAAPEPGADGTPEHRAAMAGACSHGGHGWDGETCSDLAEPAGVPVQVLPVAPCQAHGLRECFCDYGASFTCLICRAELPVEEGEPLGSGQYPSWRCSDRAACEDRWRAAQ